MDTLVCEWRPEIAGAEIQVLESRWPPEGLERPRTTLEGWLANQFSSSHLPFSRFLSLLLPFTPTTLPPHPRLPSPWNSEHSCSTAGVLYTDFSLGLVGRIVSLHRTCWAAERRNGPWDTRQSGCSLQKLKAHPMTSSMNVGWI